MAKWAPAAEVKVNTKKMGKKDCEERREGRKVQQIGDGAGSGGVFSLTPIYLHMSLHSAPL